MEFEEEG
jgi:hypothetical protein